LAVLVGNTCEASDNAPERFSFLKHSTRPVFQDLSFSKDLFFIPLDLTYSYA
jgi:hypothetical protein